MNNDRFLFLADEKCELFRLNYSKLERRVSSDSVLYYYPANLLCEGWGHLEKVCLPMCGERKKKCKEGKRRYGTVFVWSLMRDTRLVTRLSRFRHQ